jgi:hypothetical protein
MTVEEARAAGLCGVPMHHQSPAEGTLTTEDIVAARTDPRGACTCEFTPVGPETYVLPDIDRDCPVHTGELVSPCTLPRGHAEQIEDSGHYDEHGCHADVLVHKSTLREIAHVAAEWPDGIHTCAELQQLEPGRRACTCGRCPS